jgi:hypothetical protein
MEEEIKAVILEVADYSCSNAELDEAVARIIELTKTED